MVIRSIYTTVTEIVLLSILVWVGFGLSDWFFGITSSSLLLAAGAAVTLGVTLGVDRSREEQHFSAWPEMDTIGDALIGIVGYSGIVGLATALGLVVNGAIGNLVIGIIVTCVATLWFFKHIYFFMELS